MTLSPHRFLSTDADYPGVAAVPMALTFPHPVTWGDYARWARKMAEVEGDDILRLYHAALAVATLEDVPQEPAGDDEPGFTSDDLDPDDDALPMAFVSWVNECAELAIGNQLLVGGLQEVTVRRKLLPQDPATFHTADFLRLLPDLEAYPGSVTFHDPFTAGAYKRWQTAIRLLPKYAPNDPANGVMARQFRGALGLVQSWDIEGTDWGAIRRQMDTVPLVLISFLVEAADIFITRRLNRKKALRLSTII